MFCQLLPVLVLIVVRIEPGYCYSLCFYSRKASNGCQIVAAFFTAVCKH